MEHPILMACSIKYMVAIGVELNLLTLFGRWGRSYEIQWVGKKVNKSVSHWAIKWVNVSNVKHCTCQKCVYRENNNFIPQLWTYSQNCASNLDIGGIQLWWPVDFTSIYKLELVREWVSVKLKE